MEARTACAAPTLQWWLTLRLQASRKIEYACSNYYSNWLLVLIDFLLTCSFGFIVNIGIPYLQIGARSVTQLLQQQLLCYPSNSTKVDTCIGIELPAIKFHAEDNLRCHSYIFIYEMYARQYSLCEWFDNYLFVWVRVYARAFSRALKCCFRIRELVCLQKSINIFNRRSVCTKHSIWQGKWLLRDFLLPQAC